MKKKEIDFNSFEITGNNILVEVPTKTKGGLILISDKKTLQSGWFEIVKVGKNPNKDKDGNIINTEITVGKEAFVYFHHEPYEFDAIVFKSKEDQLNEIENKQALSNIVLSDNLGGLATAKSTEEERSFILVREHDILFTR
jgi:co-chaperonin GroES (HSP10)